MKTKIYTTAEWQNLCELGLGYEDMIHNGDLKHLIAIECPTVKCKAKLWDRTLGKHRRQIGCDVCHWHGVRPVGKSRDG